MMRRYRAERIDMVVSDILVLRTLRDNAGAALEEG